MREVITIQVGQAGVQIGEEFWKTMCLEEGIKVDGEPLRGGVRVDPSFFHEIFGSKFVPRAVIVDSEQDTLDRISRGPLRDLFDKSSLQKAYPETGYLFSKAKVGDTTKSLPRIQKGIRKLAEKCESLQGFFFLHSMGGGTGSGVTASIMEYLNRKFVKKPQVEFEVFPSSKMSSLTVEPYNAALLTSATLCDPKCSFLFDNHALCQIFKAKLGVLGPTIPDMNSLLAHVISFVSSSLRYTSSINSNMSDFLSNLVPFPKLRYPLVGLAPLKSANAGPYETDSIEEITRVALKPTSQILSADPRRGMCLNCCLVYRGEVDGKGVNDVIQDLKNRGWPSFVPWSNHGFKSGISEQPPSTFGKFNGRTPRSCLSLNNTTSVVSVWGDLYNSAAAMFNKRAFLHWYLADGMELEDFLVAFKNLRSIVHDYQNANK